MTTLTATARATWAGRSRFSASRSDMGSVGAPALVGADRGHLVRVLEVAAHREPPGDPADYPNASLEPLGEVHRGRLALEGRVRGEDDFLERRAVALRVVRAGEEVADL